ncbi:Dynein assembly factor 4, axonemal [Boothiomyces sp. JEL0866]|nr:Dynein assembly factor 4, axonemal [Boothiomyces sp. JEL0866]
MPIVVKKADINDSIDQLVITIPLRNVHPTKVDVYSNDLYVKIHYPPYFFEYDLFDRIDPEESIASIGEGLAILKLQKRDPKLWSNTQYVGEDIRERRQKAEEEHLKFEKEKKHAKLVQKREKERDLVRRQISVEQEKRESIEKLKEKELEAAKETLTSWSNEIREKELQSNKETKQSGINLGKDFIIEKTDSGIFTNEVHSADKKKNSIGTVIFTDEDIIVKNSDDLEDDSDIDVEAIRASVRAKLYKDDAPAPRREGTTNVSVSFSSRGPIPTTTARETEDEKWMTRIKLIKAMHARNEENKTAEIKEGETSETLKTKGDNQFKLGNFDGAVNAYNDSLQLDPLNYHCLSNRAACYLKKQDLENCIKDCTRALELVEREETIIKDELKKDDGLANERLSIKVKLYARRGSAHSASDLKKGLGDYELALKIDPGNSKIQEDILHNIATAHGKYQLTMNGILTLEVECNSLSEKVLKDTLFRTVADNNRLSSLIRDGYFVPAGDTLQDLELDCSIQNVPLNWCEKAQEMIIESEMNSPVKSHYLPWRIRFYVSPSFKRDGKSYIQLHIGLAILHTLTDGMGVTFIMKSLVENLYKSITSKTTFSLDTPLKGETIPKAFSSVAILDPRLNIQWYFWPFVFLWRVLFGLWFVINAISGLFFPTVDYKSKLDPTLIEAKSMDDVNSHRYVRLEKEFTGKLRNIAREHGGSITSLLEGAACVAYAKLAESYGKDTNFITFTNMINIRPFCADTDLIPRLKGNAILNTFEYRYEMNDEESFWWHISQIKKQIQRISYHVGPCCRMIAMMPVQLTAMLFCVQKVTHWRDSAFLFSNVGMFEREQLNWAPRIKVLNVTGSSSNVYEGNRNLINITCLTIDGRLGFSFVFPNNLAPQEDVEYFINTYKALLEEIVKNNKDMLVGDLKNL